MSRLPRPVRAAGLVLVLALALAACATPSNTPDAYDDAVQANFTEACQALDPQGGSIGTGATQSFCQCAYDWFVQNVPYDQFEALENDLGQDPTTMPQQYQQDVQAACGEGGPTATTTTVAGGSTTTAPASAPNDSVVTPTTPGG